MKTGRQIAFFISISVVFFNIVFFSLSSYSIYCVHRSKLVVFFENVDYLIVVVVFYFANNAVLLFLIYDIFIYHHLTHSEMVKSIIETPVKFPDTMVHRDEIQDMMKLFESDHVKIDKVSDFVECNTLTLKELKAECCSRNETVVRDFIANKQDVLRDIEEIRNHLNNCENDVHDLKDKFAYSISEIMKNFQYQIYNLLRNEVEIIKNSAEGKILDVCGLPINMEGLWNKLTAIKKIMMLLEETLQESKISLLKEHYNEFKLYVEKGKSRQVFVIHGILNDLKLLKIIENNISKLTDKNSPNLDCMNDFYTCICRILNAIHTDLRYDPINASDETISIENKLLKVLNTFYMEFYEKKLFRNQESMLQGYLKECDISPIAIVLNKTLLNDRYHEVSGFRKGPSEIDPLAIVQILEVGFIRPSSQEVISKAKVITNTHG